MTNILFHHI